MFSINYLNAFLEKKNFDFLFLKEETHNMNKTIMTIDMVKSMEAKRPIVNK